MIEMFETLDGGDYVVGEDDILLDNSLNSIGYTSFFGGNLKENTTQGRKPSGAFYNDYWGNCDVFNEPDLQFNSNTERQLAFTPIRSGNLGVFEQASQKDLQYLKTSGKASTVSSSVKIVNPGKIKLDVTVKQPSKTEPEGFTIFWDETLQRLSDV